MCKVKKVTFYTKENCLLCDEALDLLRVLQDLESFQLEVKDIYENDDLLEEYQLIIPVIKIDKEELSGEAINIETILINLKK